MYNIFNLITCVDDGFGGDDMPDMESLSEMMGGYGMGGMDPYGGYGDYGGYGGGYGGYGGEEEPLAPPPPREVASQDEVLAVIGESGTQGTVVAYFKAPDFDDDLEIFNEVHCPFLSITDIYI